MLEKPKLSFNIGSITIKARIEQKQKLFHDHYCLYGHLGIDDWDFTLFQRCETPSN